MMKKQLNNQSKKEFHSIRKELPPSVLHEYHKINDTQDCIFENLEIKYQILRNEFLGHASSDELWKLTSLYLCSDSVRLIISSISQIKLGWCIIFLTIMMKKQLNYIAR